MTSTRRRLKLVFVKPSKYDDDGYVIRYWKGVLPNNTLSVLCGLTQALIENRVVPDAQIEYVAFDEMVDKIPVGKIVRWSRQKDVQVLVCLVGVQTNQFPRAFDLARSFRKEEVEVIIGGFHVSGSVNVLGEEEPEIQALRDAGISYFIGEAEERWVDVLKDVLAGSLKPVYRAGSDLKNLPALSCAPMPVVPEGYMRKFAYSSFGTLDTSRGCPFGCSFCTVINVQGRKLRERDPEKVKVFLRENYLKNRVDFYFFTDDNFSRKRFWKETFEAIIALREVEDIPITFMMQVDLARKPAEFVELASRAGCTQVFLGMESVNPDNLNAEGKKQNDTNEYAEIIRRWRSAGIAVHAAYIIGFPFDTEEQVKKDIAYLRDEVSPDQASFFMLTPLPGSMDHLEMKREGKYIDPDLNKRDSFHPTIDHPHMSSEQWVTSYKHAWKTFYERENMIRNLRRWNCDPKTYWGLLSIYFWYKNSVEIEGEHPMIGGFFRLKDRKSRRPGYRVDGILTHRVKRSAELIRTLYSWGKLFMEMKDVWVRSRRPRQKELRYLSSLQALQSSLWNKLRIEEWQRGYLRVREDLPEQTRKMFQTFYEKTQSVIRSPHEAQQFFSLWKGVQVTMRSLRKRSGSTNDALQEWLKTSTRGAANTFLFSRYLDRLQILKRYRTWRLSHVSALRFESQTNQIRVTRKTWHTLRSPLRMFEHIAAEVHASFQFANFLKGNLLS